MKYHELRQGIVCEKCQGVATKGNYTRIQFIRPVVNDITGVSKTIARINLCNYCYEKYKIVLEDFFGKTFEENIDETTKLESLRNDNEESKKLVKRKK